jgi:hypothetical protein
MQLRSTRADVAAVAGSHSKRLRPVSRGGGGSRRPRSAACRRALPWSAGSMDTPAAPSAGSMATPAALARCTPRRFWWLQGVPRHLRRNSLFGLSHFINPGYLGAAKKRFKCNRACASLNNWQLVFRACASLSNWQLVLMQLLERNIYISRSKAACNYAKRSDGARKRLSSDFSGPPPPYRIMPAWVVEGTGHGRTLSACG